MLKRRKRNNGFYCLLLGTALIILNSCEERCIKKIKDERTLNEYFVEIDTCDQYNSYSLHRYFNNDGLFMYGYGDRLLKQGEWSYYFKNEEIAKGRFNNGEPIGDWEYNYLENTSWKVINDTLSGFKISIPSSWFLENERPNYSLFVSADSKNLEEANFNIVVSDYDLKISEYVNKHTDSLRTNTSIKEIDLKELSIDDIDEAFQRKFKIEEDQYQGLAFQTFYGRKDLDKVFIITINSKYSSYKKYEPIFEAMLNSFKMY